MPSGITLCHACRTAIGTTSAPLCTNCAPMVCVCAEPQPDAIGECAQCRRVYKPQHAGLMAARRAWITYLTERGVLSTVARSADHAAVSRPEPGVSTERGVAENNEARHVATLSHSAVDGGLGDPNLVLSGPQSKPG